MSVDSPSLDLKEKSMVLKIDEVNDFIRKKGFSLAKILKSKEVKEKNPRFACVYEHNLTFYEVISKIYKINCLSANYVGDNLVELHYTEI